MAFTLLALCLRCPFLPGLFFPLSSQALASFFRRRRPPASLGFNPLAISGPAPSKEVSWVDLSGIPAPPPVMASLPDPENVLSGLAAPDFDGLRLRSQDSFICGNLHRYAHVWDRYMTGVEGYDLRRCSPLVAQ